MKRIPYRNKKITRAAKGEDCTINYVNCNYNPETTVFAHLNEYYAGKGMGQKADDCAGVFACSNCHDDYDRNKIEDYSANYYLLRAYVRTIRRLIDLGVIK